MRVTPLEALESKQRGGISQFSGLEPTSNKNLLYDRATTRPLPMPSAYCPCPLFESVVEKPRFFILYTRIADAKALVRLSRINSITGGEDVLAQTLGYLVVIRTARFDKRSIGISSQNVRPEITVVAAAHGCECSSRA